MTVLVELEVSQGFLVFIVEGQAEVVQPWPTDRLVGQQGQQGLAEGVPRLFEVDEDLLILADLDRVALEKGEGKGLVL